MENNKKIPFGFVGNDTIIKKGRFGRNEINPEALQNALTNLTNLVNFLVEKLPTASNASPIKMDEPLPPKNISILKVEKLTDEEFHQYIRDNKKIILAGKHFADMEYAKNVLDNFLSKNPEITDRNFHFHLINSLAGGISIFD